MAPLRQEGIMSATHRRGRTPSPDLVAGNGLINRRALLGKGIAVAGAMGASGIVTGAAAEPREISSRLPATTPNCKGATP